MRVLARDCGALVPDNLSRNEVREAGRFEHRHRAVAQTVKRNLARLARLLSGLCRCFVSARFDKSSVNENLPELIGQV